MGDVGARASVLADARRASGLSLAEACVAMGVSQTTYLRREAAPGRASVWVLAGFAAALSPDAADSLRRWLSQTV